MASAHRKTAVAAPQGKIKIVSGGKTVNAIPQGVKFALIALALMEGRLSRTRTSIQLWRARIEAKMPGGSRLVRKPGLVAALFQEHNARIAKRAGKAVRA